MSNLWFELYWAGGTTTLLTTKHRIDSKKKAISKMTRNFTNAKKKRKAARAATNAVKATSSG
jgi:hypothetical protein